MASHRAVSIGQQFDDPRVRNVSFKSSQTLLGCDIAILNFTSLLSEYDRGNPSTYQGSPFLGEDGSFRIQSDLVRRKAEIEKLFALGKAVVVFTPPPISWFVDSGKKEYSGTGKNRQPTTLVQPMRINSVFPFEIETAAAESENLELSSSGPFAQFWAAVKMRFDAAATIQKAPGETTLTIAGTDESVGAVAQIENGLLILLPGTLLYEDSDYPDEPPEDFIDPQDVSFLDPLFELVTELRRGSGEYELPGWLDQYRLSGEAEALNALRSSEASVESALLKRDESEKKLVSHQQRKLLVAASGAALERIAEAAFLAIGFKVEGGKPNRADRIIRRGRNAAVVEIKGKSKSAGEKDAAQLEKWAAEFIEEEGKVPKAILVVNAERKTPIADRSQSVFPDQMLPYCEKREQCLMTSAQLLAAWQEVEGSPSKKAEVARSIMKCVGRYDRYPANGGDVLVREAELKLKKDS